jgi:hypothetical protein
VRIVEVLCRETAAILDEMGVHAVKHLKVSSQSVLAANCMKLTQRPRTSSRCCRVS